MKVQLLILNRNDKTMKEEALRGTFPPVDSALLEQ